MQSKSKVGGAFIQAGTFIQRNTVGATENWVSTVPILRDDDDDDNDDDDDDDAIEWTGNSSDELVPNLFDV